MQYLFHISSKLPEDPTQYAEGSPEWNLAMIKFLLKMKASGHKINEVQINKVSVRRLSRGTAGNREKGGLEKQSRKRGQFRDFPLLLLLLVIRIRD